MLPNRRSVRRPFRTALLVGIATLVAHVSAAAENPDPRPGYYTQAQAQRGKLSWNTHCLHCHGGAALTTVNWQVGYRVGSQYNGGGRAPFGLTRKTSARDDGRPKFPSVYYLFARIRESMPGWGPDSVSHHEKADIVAYILEMNGYPAGTRELTPDVAVMKTMWLVEPGFQPLFNGRDFTGWKFVIGPNCRLAPVGCAKPDPGTTFRVDSGEIVTDGKIHSYAYTEKKYKDFTLRLQFKWVVPPDWSGEQDGVTWWGDSGIFLFVGDEHQVWPRALQLNLTVPDIMRPIPMNTKAKTTQDLDAIAKGVLQPLGAWNNAEVVSKDGVVTAFINGVPVATIREHEFTGPGHLALQSEGGEVRFRNIRIKAE